MPLLFWLDIIALSISAVTATSLALMVLSPGAKLSLNRSFALFALTEAAWAIFSLLLCVSLWLEVGTPLLLAEIATLIFALLGPCLLLFATRYVSHRTRWMDLAVGVGVVATAVLSIFLFQHQFVYGVYLDTNGTTILTISPWGIAAAAVPAAYLAWSMVLFGRERRRPETLYLVLSVLILIVGLVVGGVLNVRFPVVSITNTVGVGILGYMVVSRQLFNPLRELTEELERKVAERTQELEDAYREVERAYEEVEGWVDERTAELKREIAERKRLEHELEERRLYLESVLACAPDAVITLGARGGILEWNIGAERLFGYSAEKAVGQDVDKLIAGADPRIFKEASAFTQRALSGERIPPVETIRYRKDGRPVAVLVSGSPIMLGNEMIGVVAVYTDITERKRAELERAKLLSALQHRSTQLQTAVEVSKSASVILNPEVLIDQAVHLIQERFGFYYVGLFLIDELGEYAVLRAGTGEAFAKMREAGHRLRVGGTSMIGWCTAHGEARIALDVGEEAMRFENPFLPHTRSEMALPLISRGLCIGALTVQSAEPAAFSQEDIAVLRTMADQVAIAIENARLLEEERRRSAELEALRQASLHVTSSLESQSVLEAILEHTLRLVSADNAHIFLYDGEQLTFGAAMWAGGAKREPYVEPRLGGLTYTVARSGEQIVIPHVDLHPLFHGRRWGGAVAGLPLRVSGKVCGVMNVAFEDPHIFTDNEQNVLELLADQAAIAINNASLHQQVRLHADELAEALARQEELDRLKGEFIQNVSHELRSPLALIRGYADMLVNGELGELRPEQQKPTAIISRRAWMLSDLVESITLTLEAEARPLKRELVALDEVARTAVEDFRMAADQAGLTLEEQVEDIPQISGSLTYLRRVLDNLLSNAVKFTSEGGTIIVRVWQEDGLAKLQVRDTGIGIPPDQLKRIFERFYQVDGSARRRYGGVGLGLALVKELVELHGGQVIVESRVGEGSAFTVTLPIFAPGV